MHFAKLVFICSSFMVAALAQSKIAFTTLPSSVQAGVPTTLRWAGGDDTQPVTLTLQQGPPDNLQTVAIITGRATGNSFTWTPSKSLPNADDYALKISQGVDDTNYTGQFSLSGGSAAVATSSSSSSSLAIVATRSSSSSSLAIVTSAATLSSAIASLNNTVSSLVGSVSNATSAATTVAILAGTGAVASGGSSAATGTVMHRNTTMSSATLTSTRTTSTGGSSTGGSSTTGDASTATGTSSAPSTAPSSDAMRMASPLAFVLSAFVAIVYLG